MQLNEVLSDCTEEELSADNWVKRGDDILVKVVNSWASSIFRGSDSYLTSDAIKNYCPGITTTLLSSHSSLRAALGTKNTRKPKSNDVVDAMHSIYAPYVDFLGLINI